MTLASLPDVHLQLLKTYDLSHLDFPGLIFGVNPSRTAVWYSHRQDMDFWQQEDDTYCESQ